MKCYSDPTCTSPVTNNSGVNGAAGDSSRQPLPSLATLGGEISDATVGKYYQYGKFLAWIRRR